MLRDLTCVATVCDTFIELIEKQESKLCQVSVISCGLCFCISLASKKMRSEPREVEKGLSTQPIDATSFLEE